MAGGAYIGALRMLPGDLLHRDSGFLANWQLTAGLLVIAILFALWPDVDTNSIGQNIVYATVCILDTLLIITSHYEAAAEYPLQRLENPDEPLNWRVDKMRLSKDKTALVYNDFDEHNDDYPKPIFWGRYTTNTNIAIERRRSGPST